MIKPKLIILISLLLDGVIYKLITLNSYFLPLLTLISIFMIYPYYKKRVKEYFITIIITGIIYDLIYTNMLFFHAIIFFIISILIKYLYKNFIQSILKLPFYIIIIIICYEVLIAVLLFIYKVVPITIPKIMIKISHSLIINIIYGEIIYLLTKNKKIS